MRRVFKRDRGRLGQMTEEAPGKRSAPRGRRSLEGAGLVCIEDGWASASTLNRPSLEAAPIRCTTTKTVPLQQRLSKKTTLDE